LYEFSVSDFHYMGYGLTRKVSSPLFHSPIDTIRSRDTKLITLGHRIYSGTFKTKASRNESKEEF